MDQATKELVHEALAATFGIDRSVLDASGVVIVESSSETADVACVLVDRTCVLRVPASLASDARSQFFGLDAEDAFSREALDRLIGARGKVLGLSWHHYGDVRSLRVQPDAAVQSVDGKDEALWQFLRNNSLKDWAEGGFPENPATAEPVATFHVLRERGRIVAAGNLTDWRGQPADVGLLVHPAERGRGLAFRLAGAMLSDALPNVGVARYRALSTNAASLAIADRIGFERYGGNYLARLDSP